MKVLVISDNKNMAKLLRDILIMNFAPSPEIQLAVTLCGRKFITAFKPDIVVLDIDSPDCSDMADYISKLAPKHSVPIIACTSQRSVKYLMLNAGAMDVVTLHETDDGAERFSRNLYRSIEATLKTVEENRKQTVSHSTRLIAIGGSTGSTNALPVLLKGLKKDSPPVVCVLHMPENYTKIYADQLNDELPFEVCEAQSGMYITQGQVIIAAGSKHLRIFKDKKGYFTTSERGVKVSGHCPSVDVLFDSCAYAAKSDAIGVILTGMGCDGAKGMLNMRKMGAYNIAQDEESSVVYGMPRAAYENGAANVVRPLDKIADEINRRLCLCGRA